MTRKMPCNTTPHEVGLRHLTAFSPKLLIMLLVNTSLTTITKITNSATTSLKLATRNLGVFLSSVNDSSGTESSVRLRRVSLMVYQWRTHLWHCYQRSLIVMFKCSPGLRINSTGSTTPDDTDANNLVLLGFCTSDANMS